MKVDAITLTSDMMEPGPELDMLIAEKVMEYPIIDVTPPCDHVNLPFVPHIAKLSDTPLNFHFHRPMNNPEKNYNWGNFQPSTSISDAWKVEEKIGAMGEEKRHVYIVELCHQLGNALDYDSNSELMFACCQALPIMRCRAALKTVMG